MKKIVIWWLSFKTKTDNIRDALSIYVINRLLDLWRSWKIDLLKVIKMYYENKKNNVYKQ